MTMKFNQLFAIAAIFMAGSVHAGFQFETAPAKREPTAAQGARNVDTSARMDRVAKMNRQRIDLESRLTARITQSGETPMELPVIKGMGRDVSFEDALRQILPPGWSAYSDQDLPMSDLVNWTGNRTWPLVLHAVLADKDMRAHVDWKNQEIMFFAPALKEELTVPVQAAPGVAVVKTEVKPDAKVDAKAPKTAAQVEVKDVIWTLSPEHTLRENLRRWATAANWSLVWNAVTGDTVIDYPVDVKVDFGGELLGPNGAMAKVITAYSDADFPLAIEFFRGNRVIEVRLHRVPDARQPGEQQVTVPPRQAQTK